MKFTLRPTIFSNGLILVSIPLLFEIAFAGTLFYLQQDYEKKLQAQIHANQVVSHTNEMWLAGMDITMGNFATKIFPQQRLKTRFHVSKIDVEYRALTKLLESEDPAQLPKLHRMRARADALINLSQRFEDPDLTGGIAGLRGNLMQFQTLQLMVKQLGDDMAAFRKPWEQRTEQSEVAIAEVRKLITTVTISGVVLSIIIAAFLFTYFMRSIYGGISSLMANTYRFARKEPLLPASTRSDELAQLDRTFHEMAQTVEAASLEHEQLQKLKQDFFHMITHDMRTPISSIILSLEALSSGMAGDVSEEAMPTVGRAEKNANMLINLVSDLLDLETSESQGLSLQIEEFDIKEALEEVAQLVESLASRAAVTVVIEASAGTVSADRIRFLRVLSNLVGNAIKFSPPGTKVIVRANCEADRVTVEVIDQGRGIPADHIEAIFNRFHQVEKDDSRKKRGSGLGLPIAKAFVEAHGGVISVESEPQKGSRFWFWIPSRQLASGDITLSAKTSDPLPENFPNSA